MIFEALITKRINRDRLLEIISKIFDISSQEIFITNNVCNLNINVNKNIQILWENSEPKGDFLVRVCIYLRYRKIKDIEYSEERFFIKLCQLLKCKCLISDNTNNPFTWILFESNNRQTVNLIPEYLDREIYIIATH